jgi:formylglycine-generating enzyme required for sulfatase activity
MGSVPAALRYGSGDNYPMYNVTWNEVKDFIVALNKLDGAGKFRLPTEAEWEYAARGGSSQQTYTYAGSSTIGNVAWYTDNSSSKSHPTTDLKVANGVGAYNMSGNVWEWCEDYFGGSTGENVIPVPTPQSGSGRVIRGGSWNGGATYCTVSYRSGSNPGDRRCSNGFRLACSSNP